MIQRPKWHTSLRRWCLGADAQYFLAACAAASILWVFSCCWISESWDHTDVSLQELSRFLNETPSLPLDTMRKVASAINPEIMSAVSQQFSPKYKNPCWQRPVRKAHKPSLQCLPYVYVMGSFHSGCLSLQQKLAVHPRVAAGKVSSTHFWSEEKVSAEVYLDVVDEVVPRVMQNPQESVIMDASQSYFTFYWAEAERTHREYRHVMLPCWRNCTSFFRKRSDALQCMAASCYPMAQSADRFAIDALNVTYKLVQTPMLFKAVYGESAHPRFIVLLRNPVDRLYSGFYRYLHYTHKYGKDRRGFNRYVNEQLVAFRNCAAKHGEVDCVLYFETYGLEEETAYFHADQLLRGVYSVYVEFWFKYFPREQFLFIKAEDFFTKTNETLLAVLQHLGLERPPTKLWNNMVKGYVPPKIPTPGMDSSTRARLEAFYAPFNKRLQQLLGPNFTW